MIDLMEDARPDERFHTQHTRPMCKGWGVDWLLRRVRWYGLWLPGYTAAGQFSSYIFLWVFRWYCGTVKCDGTRTFVWQGSGGADSHPGEYVMTTTPRELFSVRLSLKRPDRERWNNMGGL